MNSLPQSDRRKADRRKSSRDGKYDRRKNVCGICRYYKAENPHQGQCLKHERTVTFQEFACPLFTLQSQRDDSL